MAFSTFLRKAKLVFMGSAKQLRMLATGEQAPQFDLPALSGGQVSSRELVASAPVVVAFFKVSCPVCQYTFPFLERLHSSGKVRVYGISQDDADDTREFNKRFGVTFPTLLDTADTGYRASNAFGLNYVPSVFRIEPGGRISWAMEGFNKRQLEALAGEAGAGPLFRPEERVPEMRSG
jgi:peroxiredoxin